MSDVRDHYVYTAYNSEGRVLYVGCTKDLEARQKAHRYGSDWYPLAVRFHIRGPFTFAAGRKVESERLIVERPLYGFHPKRRTYNAIYRRVYKREHELLVSQGGEFWTSLKEALALAKALVPGGDNNREPLDLTDELLRLAFAAEQKHFDGLKRIEGAA